MRKCAFSIFLDLSPWLGTNTVLEHFEKHNYEINYETATKLATFMPQDPDIILKIQYKLPLEYQFAVMGWVM